MRLGPRIRGNQPISGWIVGGRRIKVINAASDTISGGYRIITFHADGELIVYDYPLSLEYLVVGGGGGGGTAIRKNESNARALGGGGGGGGLLTNVGSPTVVQPGKHRIKVGAGGATNVEGGFSSFSDFVYVLGGAAGSYKSTALIAVNAIDRGNGGGASIGTDFYGTHSVSIFSYGFAGGISNTNNSAGGGGGAGGNGTSADFLAGTIGNGGIGVANSITGSSVTYAGGGGGGVITAPGTTGGTGGGGNGGINTAGANGTANLGGGGGGGATNSSTERAGGSGGSGIVIVRFPAT